LCERLIPSCPSSPSGRPTTPASIAKSGFDYTLLSRRGHRPASEMPIASHHRTPRNIYGSVIDFSNSAGRLRQTHRTEACMTANNRYRSIWISDTHLGTRGCKADFLRDFLRHNESAYLYLVGDIVDGWSLKRAWYWSQSHSAIPKIESCVGAAPTVTSGNGVTVLRPGPRPYTVYRAPGRYLVGAAARHSGGAKLHPAGCGEPYRAVHGGQTLAQLRSSVYTVAG
jgi:hypothetical protein